MSDEHSTDPSAPTATTTTTTSPPANQPDDTVNLTKGELADLLRKAANNSAAQTRHRLESDPKLQRAKQLASLYDEAFRPEPARTEPAKPAASSRLEQLMEHYLALQLAERMPKAPPPTATGPVRIGDRIDSEIRNATAAAGAEKGTAKYNAIAKETALKILRSVKPRGG